MAYIAAVWMDCEVSKGKRISSDVIHYSLYKCCHIIFGKEIEKSDTPETIITFQNKVDAFLQE